MKANKKMGGNLNHGITSAEIGERMKAFRLGAGLSPEELAEAAGVSRAAIYRYEAGHPAKIDVLVKIADLLNVSLPTLLGAGVEYISSAVSFFERMRQLEESVDQITVLFGPISFLLTTDNFDKFLHDVLLESIPDNVSNRQSAMKEVGLVLDILMARKQNFQERNPNIISLLSAGELTQFLRLGLVGAHNPPGVDMRVRRAAALTEIEHIVSLLKRQPIGTQIGVVVDSMPGTSFQVFKQASRKSVAVSPFRLCSFANVRLGVATISAAHDATERYQEVTNELWAKALKGDRAAEYIEKHVLGAYA